MIYPSDFEAVIGFDRIRQSLLEACRYDSSRKAAAEMPLITDYDSLVNTFDLLDEWKMFSSQHAQAFNPEGTSDISAWLNGLQVENFYFNEEELLSIYHVGRAYSTLYRQISRKKEDYPLLSQLLSEVSGISEAEQIILSVIDLKGDMRPNASVELGKLNNAIGKLEQESRQLTRSLFRQWREAGFTADTEMTIREERLVIPIKAEFKRKVQGFVKDVSATGQVLYIEPVESLELNNRLKELYADRRREREKILIATADRLRPLSGSLAACMEGLWKIDYLDAKNSLASRLEANRPGINKEHVIQVRNGYHPVLRQLLGKDKKNMVPLNLKLDRQERMMIISGPNAGGKSISLKTAMLLQYMAQHGLFVPSGPDSSYGIFRHFLIDCGDGQSLDAGLSTFSAHLMHLKKMDEMAGPGVLIGIDEIGDGTDPRFGGPIAQSILENLLKKEATAIVTTHFSRLKEWAGHTTGVLNASMAYDTEKLQPLYVLVSGRPGSSFALELLRKTGFSDHLLGRVKELSGEESGKTEDLLLELEQRQHELSRQLQESAKKQAHLDHLLEEYRKIKEKLETRKSDILEQAREKARKMLDEANRQIELTIRVIQENKAEKKETGKARAKLNQFAEKVVKPAIEKKPVQQIPKTAVKINWIPGMLVRSLGNNNTGEVLEVKKGKLKVAFGLVQIWIPENELEAATETKQSKKKLNTSGFNWVERNAVFSPTLDVRGMTGEEAMKKVMVWMDEAYALGQFNLKIIHGRGDGILRKTLREYFKSLGFVKSYRSEREEQGGDGCTLVELR